MREREDSRIVELLLASLKQRDLAVIAVAYSFFIQRGKPGSEDALIQALNSYGSKEMAQAYLNCGNSALKQAGENWAGAHSYAITSSRGWGTAQWGSQR